MTFYFLRLIFVALYAVSLAVSVMLLLKKSGFFWITIYVLLSAIADISLWLIPTGSYNHYAFASGMIVTGFALLMYYAKTIGTRIAYFLYSLSFGILITVYLKHKMWQPSLLMPEYYVAGYYAIMASASAYFLWRVIMLEKTNLPTKPLWFGSIFMVYFTISMFCHSFVFGSFLHPAQQEKVYIILYVMNFAFEISKFLVFVLLYHSIKR